MMINIYISTRLLGQGMIIEKTWTLDSYIFLMASCKLWVSLANKNKEQQMTRMDGICLYITQNVCSLIPLKTKDAPY
jgi:hypothetical protein